MTSEDYVTVKYVAMGKALSRLHFAEAEALKAWISARPWIFLGTPAERAEASAARKAWQLAKAAREAS